MILRPITTTLILFLIVLFSVLTRSKHSCIQLSAIGCIDHHIYTFREFLLLGVIICYERGKDACILGGIVFDIAVELEKDIKDLK